MLPPKKAKTVHSARKVMMTIFFYHEGFIYQHRGPPQTTANALWYIKVQNNALTFSKKSPTKKVEDILLHHDNACPMHVAKIVAIF